MANPALARLGIKPDGFASAPSPMLCFAVAAAAVAVAVVAEMGAFADVFSAANAPVKPGEVGGSDCEGGGLGVACPTVTDESLSRRKIGWLGWWAAADDDGVVVVAVVVAALRMARFLMNWISLSCSMTRVNTRESPLSQSIPT